MRFGLHDTHRKPPQQQHQIDKVFEQWDSHLKWKVLFGEQRYGNKAPFLTSELWRLSLKDLKRYIEYCKETVFWEVDGIVEFFNDLTANNSSTTPTATNTSTKRKKKKKKKKRPSKRPKSKVKSPFAFDIYDNCDGEDGIKLTDVVHQYVQTIGVPGQCVTDDTFCFYLSLCARWVDEAPGQLFRTVLRLDKRMVSCFAQLGRLA